jgi:hypothetical protein
VRLRRSVLMTTGVLAMLGAGVAAYGVTTSSDTRANAPQVSGDPTSDLTAVFPTNKQNEPTIAVDPTNAMLLIAGSNDEQRQPPCGPGPVRGATTLNDCSFFPGVGTSGVYTSSDGGKHWTNRGLLDDQQSWKDSALISDGDPVVVFGPKPMRGGAFSYDEGARAYYATLASYKDGRSPFPPNKAPELMAVSWSDDNGVSWSAPVVATVKDNPNDFNDKESIWVDDLASSPFFGRLYLSWTEFRSATATGNGSEPVMVAVSGDAGSTWSAPKQVSPAGNNGANGGRQGSVVRSGPDGTAYVAWEEGSAQVISRSLDGGTRWSRPVSMGSVVDIHDPIPGSNFRTNSFPLIAADPRDGSTTLSAAWATRTADGGRVVVVSSSNRGATWSAPTTVSGAEGYAFYQGLDIASNGRVDVGYQAQTAVNPAIFGTGNAAVNSYYVSKAVNGSWTTPVKVSTVASDPAASAQNNLGRQFFGDYNTLVSTASNAWLIYTDTRNGVGCPAVDEYQVAVFGTGVIRGDMADRVQRRLGNDPYAHEPGTKPAPPTHCSGQFGNSDAYVSRITP